MGKCLIRSCQHSSRKPASSMGLGTQARILHRIDGPIADSVQTGLCSTRDVGDKIGLVPARHSALIVYPGQAWLSWGRGPEPYAACFIIDYSAEDGQ